ASDIGLLLLLRLLVGGRYLSIVLVPPYHARGGSHRRADGRALARVTPDGAAPRAHGGAAPRPTHHGAVARSRGRGCGGGGLGRVEPRLLGGPLMALELVLLKLLLALTLRIHVHFAKAGAREDARRETGRQHRPQSLSHGVVLS